MEGLVQVSQEIADTQDHLLFDYDIDDDSLKPKHKAFLDETLAFMARNLSARRQATKPGRPAWRVSLDGFASRTGTREHNLELSARRERSVQDFLSNGTQKQRPELFTEV